MVLQPDVRFTSFGGTRLFYWRLTYFADRVQSEYGNDGKCNANVLEIQDGELTGKAFKARLLMVSARNFYGTTSLKSKVLIGKQSIACGDGGQMIC